MSFGGAEHVIQINYEILYVFLSSCALEPREDLIFVKDAGNKSSNLIQNVNIIAL